MTHRSRLLPDVPFRAAALFTALLLSATPALAQQNTAATAPADGLRAELVRDLEQLEQKYVGLAEAMTDQYQWRPAEDVRSVSEVFMHVANANFMIPTMVGIQPPEALRAGSMQETMAMMQAREKITDAAEVREALRASFAHARDAIVATPDAELDDMTKLFGQDATKRRVLTLLVAHLHEHLGQAIAYARTNGVTPPWSAGD